MNLSAVYDGSEALIARLVSHLQTHSNSPKAVILSYHNIYPLQKIDNSPDSVTVDQFAAHMQFLYQAGVEVLSFQQLIEKIREQASFSSVNVVLTFDDGYLSTYELAQPILMQYAFPATIFLATNYIGSYQPFPWLAGQHSSDSSPALPLSWEQVQSMTPHFEIGSHTCSHPFLPYQSAQTIGLELRQSQTRIAEKIGQIPKTCALPYSFPLEHHAWPGFKATLMQALESANYVGCCNLMRGYVNLKSHPYFLPRLVIGKNDTRQTFALKVRGFYGWTKYPQWIYQKFIKKYREIK